MNESADLFLKRRAQLEHMGEHWQKYLAYGDPGVGWEGDRALALYWAKLTDEMEVWYELPNQKPVLIFKVDVDGFDIHRICAMLRDADHRRRDAGDIIKEVDDHNDKVMDEAEKAKKEVLDEAHDKLHWALRKDTGNHVAPITVPELVVP